MLSPRLREDVSVTMIVGTAAGSSLCPEPSALITSGAAGSSRRNLAPWSSISSTLEIDGQENLRYVAEAALDPFCPALPGLGVASFFPSELASESEVALFVTTSGRSVNLLGFLISLDAAMFAAALPEAGLFSQERVQDADLFE